MKKDTKELLKLLDNEDFRDNFRGKKLIDYISKYFIINMIKCSNCEKGFREITHTVDDCGVGVSLCPDCLEKIL